MRFLHMADLHLGKILNDISLLEDQRIILKEVAALASEKKADAVVIAGDVYQKAAPQAEAMTLFNEFLSDLHSRGIPVIAISGNHDSDERVAYLRDFVARFQIHLASPFHGVPDSVVMADEYGEVEFHLLPFLRTSSVKKFYPGEKISSIADAVRCVIEHTPLDEKRRHVMIAHQFIVGSEVCDSEERIVGGLDAIPENIFTPFDYTALGHIHTPQSFLDGRMRYSGSLMKYSFSEVRQHKGILLVELNEKGSLKVEKLPLHYPHEMRDIKGSMEDIMDMPPTEDYLRVTLTDEDVPPDAQITLRQAFKNLMVFKVENSKTNLEMTVNHTENVENRSMEDLFCAFYAERNNGAVPPEAELMLLREILAEMEVNNK